MKSAIIAMLLCYGIQTVSFAKRVENKDIVITISSDRDVILPCTPLGVAVILKNESGDMIEKTGSQWTSFRIKKKGSGGIWQTYMACGPHATLMPPRKLRLFPGQPFEDICLIHVNSNNEPVFNEEGVYYVQAGTPFGESEAIKITVELPETSVEAVETMRSNKLFVLFDDYTASCFLGQVISADVLSKNLNVFRDMHGSAPYSGWIVVADFLLKKTMISHQPESKRPVLYDELIAEYDIVASKLPTPQKEGLMMAIATVQMDQSKKKEALDLLQQIGSTNTNVYFKIRAQYLENLYRGQRLQSDGVD